MQPNTGRPVEWLVPLAFIFCAGWLIWHMPAFILDWGGHGDQLAAHFARVDVAPGLPVVLGSHIDILDLLSLIMIPVLAVLGVMTVRRAPMEFEAWGPLDRLSVFIGRVTMMLVVVLVSVMLYEVFNRYVLNAGTLWANEMSLWLAGFIFLCSGLYAMQQRSHIRIFLLYDVLPRWLQKVCDTISTLLIVLFAFFLFYGGYGEAFQKFGRWELYGSAFNPPIPATVKPTVLFIVAMVAVQAVINLISDWNAEPVIHTAADDIDEDELRRLKKAVGTE
ncbi:TRAP transporter small permease subunit [Actibacterium sp. 188UL27-1]|uniref:TRAP transporter small permease subunit n=1 Tax=Actibacterium sp. 188UL27-1 TaxID=2786961 RepID=UPI0019595865|nr:TRAP transporter small permease [Actibacterium sp. 188UL27-1]MBM7066834.1 TRAP transporter small permease [Actibacterium sp. 188UL27-1]